jgi:hypothetical protein
LSSLNVNTDLCFSLATRLSNAKRFYIFENPVQQSVHNSIMSSIDSLALYLNSSASSLMSAENGLLSGLTFNTNKFSTSSDVSFSSSSTSKTIYNTTPVLSGSVQYAYKSVEKTSGTATKYASLEAGLGDVRASGSATCYIFDNDKKLDPGIALTASASASLASLTHTMGYVQSSATSLTSSVQASVGTVYANAEAYAGKNGLILDGSVGAAAVRGEAKIAFKVLGTTVTFTAIGTLGSAEASFSARFTNKEWEFGSSLGFIAGLGYKINIKKDSQSLYSNESS